MRRRYQRVVSKIEDLNLTLETDGSVVEAKAKNLSRQGMFIQGQNLPPVNQKVRFKMKISELADTISGEALVRWVEGADGPTSAGAGLEILKFTSSSRSVLYHYLLERIEKVSLVEFSDFDFVTALAKDPASTAVYELTRLGSRSVVVLNENGSVLGVIPRRELTKLALDSSKHHMPVSGFAIETPNAPTWNWTFEKAATEVVISLADYLPVTDGDQAVAIVDLQAVMPFWHELLELRNEIAKIETMVCGGIAVDLRSRLNTLRRSADKSDEMLVNALDQCLRLSWDLAAKLSSEDQAALPPT